MDFSVIQKILLSFTLVPNIGLFWQNDMLVQIKGWEPNVFAPLQFPTSKIDQRFNKLGYSFIIHSLPTLVTKLFLAV